MTDVPVVTGLQTYWADTVGRGAPARPKREEIVRSWMQKDSVCLRIGSAKTSLRADILRHYKEA